jgi:peptidoglycan/LPS O-acetylase OafA/YrhL
MTHTRHEHILDLRRRTANDAPASTGMRASHRHLPALDGLRGLAIVLVFLVHYGGGAKSSFFPLRIAGLAVQAGWTGVTLFFILSGFLISGILWDARDQLHPWRNFYMRRVLRIFPLYYAALLIVVLAATVTLHARTAWTHLYIYALYIQNIPLPFNAGNLGSPLELAHFWSLAVEEQFYLLWPFLLLRLKTLRQARALCLAVFLLSAAFRVFAWFHLPAAITPLHPTYRVFLGAYGFTLSRVGELAAGGYLAMCYREPVLWQRLKRWAPVLLFAGAAAFLGAAAHAGTFTDECAEGYLIGLLCMTLCFSGLLVLSLEPGIVNRLANIRILRWLGGISYGFYVFHVLFMHQYEAIAHALAPNAGNNVIFGLEFLVAAVLTTLLAFLSFRFFESPFLRLRSRYRNT